MLRNLLGFHSFLCTIFFFWGGGDESVLQGKVCVLSLVKIATSFEKQEMFWSNDELFLFFASSFFWGGGGGMCTTPH